MFKNTIDFAINIISTKDLFTYKHIIELELTDAIQCNDRANTAEIASALTIINDALSFRLFIYHLEVEKELLDDVFSQNGEEVKHAS